MIYYSETPLRPWQPNLIILDLEDDIGHIYVTRNTYNQAILLSDRFDHDTELVTQKLGCPINQEDTASYMVAVLPSPINILTPFYNLIDSNVRLDVNNLKQVIGVLSYMSMNLDFNMMLKVPFEVRANLIFTKSILLDYQGHYEDFNFRIFSDERHISLDGKEVVRSPRSERADFNLEEKIEEEQFDLDVFMSDIGWDDISIPVISNSEKTVKDTFVSEIRKTGADYAKETDEADIYAAIANRFV